MMPNKVRSQTLTSLRLNDGTSGDNGFMRALKCCLPRRTELDAIAAKDNDIAELVAKERTLTWQLEAKDVENNAVNTQLRDAKAGLADMLAAKDSAERQLEAKREENRDLRTRLDITNAELAAKGADNARLYALVKDAVAQKQPRKFTNATLRAAVDGWCRGGTELLIVWERYGHISDWDTSEVTDMSNVFKDKKSFNEPLHWDTRNVTNMSFVFAGAKSFDQPLRWDTSNVTDMSSMFYQAENFSQPLVWNTSAVTDMKGMFNQAHRFNEPLNGWDTSNVTDMKGLFTHAKSFNQPLNQWDTSSVTDMSSMFYNASSFNQRLNGWDTSNVSKMIMMFSGATNFSQTLNWDTSKVERDNPNVNFAKYWESAFSGSKGSLQSSKKK